MAFTAREASTKQFFLHAAVRKWPWAAAAELAGEGGARKEARGNSAQQHPTGLEEFVEGK